MFHDKTINPQLKAVKENPAFINFYKKDKQIRTKYYRGLKKGIPLAPLEPNNLILSCDCGVRFLGLSLILDNGNGTYVPLYNEVIEFPEYSVKDNQDRRSFRTVRRIHRRNKLRKKELVQILSSLDLYDENWINYKHPFKIGLKGLNEPLTNAELTAYILYRNKNRGYQYSVDETKKFDGGTKEIISNNKKRLKEENLTYPCEIQSKYFDSEEKNHSFRGENNFYETSLYMEEMNKVLSNSLSPDKIKIIMDRLYSRRSFDKGPGSEKSPTPYGSYYYDDVEIMDENTGEIYKQRKIVHVDMLEKMKNNCPIIKTEKVMCANYWENLLFNLLNDLNNLIIDANTNNSRGLTPEEKKKIINYISTEKNHLLSLEKICELIEIDDIEKISGYRINSVKKPIFTDFKVWRKYLKTLDILIDKNVDSSVVDSLRSTEKYNEFVNVLSTYKNDDDRRRLLSSRGVMSDDVVDIVFDNMSWDDVSGNGSFSIKAVNTYFLNDMINKERCNSETIIRQKRIGYLDDGRHGEWADKNIRHIPFLDNKEYPFMSPVARRSANVLIERINFLRETLDVEFGRIIFEMPRDKNSEIEIKRINYEQKVNELRNKELKQKLSEINVPINDKNMKRLRLYNDLCTSLGRPIDLYTGEIINFNELFSGKYEVDHILPQSITHDNDYENLVLTSRTFNNSKSNQRPIDIISPAQIIELNKILEMRTKYEEKLKQKNKNRDVAIIDTYGVSVKKLKYILFNGDLKDYKYQKGFIARNLCDTRYVAKAVTQQLSEFFRVKKLDSQVHILSINGNQTSYFRNLAFRKEGDDEWNKNIKNRDCIYNHAVDSYLIALIGAFSNVSSDLNKFRYFRQKKEVRGSNWSIPFGNKKEEKGKFIKMLKDDIFLNETIELEHQDQENKNWDELIYSDKIYVACLHSTKKKGSISDQTIKSVKKMIEFDKKGNEKEIYWLMAKTKDIYTNDGFKQVKKIFDSRKEDKFLCYHGHGTQIIEWLREWLYKDDLIDENGNKVTNTLNYYKKQYGPFKLGGNPVHKLSYIDVKYKKLSDINKIDITHKMRDCSEDKTICLTYLYGNRNFLFIDNKGKRRFYSDLYKFNGNNLTEVKELEEYQNIRNHKEKTFFNSQVYYFKNRPFYISSCDAQKNRIVLKNIIYKKAKDFKISLNKK